MWVVGGCEKVSIVVTICSNERNRTQFCFIAGANPLLVTLKIDLIMKFCKKGLCVLLWLMILCPVGETVAQVALSREQILAMSTEELSELPLEDLMAAVETLGVSSVDELFALIMNKNVSSASKQEENTFTSPLSTTVITHDEMRSYGVSTIEEAFRLIPGMIVSEKTNGVYDIHTRGLNNIPDNNLLLYTENSNTLVMVDGRPVNNVAMGAVNFDMLPIDIEDVERIEVVRGASSALYGANAVTGVINILTMKPDGGVARVSGSAQMGNLGTYVGNVALRKAFSDKLALGLTVSVQQRDRPTDKLYVIPASGVVLAGEGAPAVESTFTVEQLGEYMQSGVLRDMSGGGYIAAEDVESLRQLYTADKVNYSIYDCLEPETPIGRMFPDPGLARRTESYNGYVAITPNERVRFDVTGGYQRSHVNTTPVCDDYFSFNGRTSKSGYVAVAANVGDLKVLLNYKGGPGDYALGVPGFKSDVKQFNASAEYDIHAGGLMIRPGVAYSYLQSDDYVPTYDDLGSGYGWHYHDPGTYEYAADDHDNLSGFCNYTAYMKSFSPSIRLDYRVGDVRLIGSFRSDRTNIPDKWNHSWQFSANYSINGDNFVRFVYGRANRSAILVNSNANFTWHRTTLLAPDLLQFSADPEANLAKIDNFEVGYRVKPASSMLIDAEVFYSRSSDFGALMANNGFVRVDKSLVDGYIAGNVTANEIYANLRSYASIKYGVLPYKVSQYGLSFNIDWIISSKLIAKLNANVQKTTIDDYYQYSQTQVIQNLLLGAQEQVTTYIREYIGILTNTTLTAEEKKGKLAEYRQYALGSNYNLELNTYDVGTHKADDIRDLVEHGGEVDEAIARNFGSVKQDGVENKATPRVYGMLGVIYKPLQQLSVSAFANFMSKRKYATKYNSEGEELPARCTVNLKVGYKPVDAVELFFNAHNLFNNEKREFVYSDVVKGVYSVGLNFNL